MNTGELEQQVERWIDGDPDEHDRSELAGILACGDYDELKDRMNGELQFGTAGLRGVMGAGCNRMNRAVICRATAGLAAHLVASEPNAPERGVVVGFDARRKSRQFACEVAEILAGAGIRVHLFGGIVPTPLVAFATTHLNAAAGIMITASHNPPEYNGYKVYWSNGAQIIPPHDQLIAAQIMQCPPARNLARAELSKARATGIANSVPADVLESYFAAIDSISVNPGSHDNEPIVYTPMHGVGNVFAREALARAGFTNVISVPRQAEPDGEFPTVRFPNPEEPGALDLAIECARSVGSNLVIANDPDADRLAVAVRDFDGEFVQLTGNQVGVLLGHYLLAETPNPPPNRLVVTTIVSSPMLALIATQLGVRCELTLTGFKWMANRAMELEQRERCTTVFAYEEALGYSCGTIVRDKDGISAARLVAELAGWCRAQGRTLLGELERISRRFGLFASSQRSLVCQGAGGAAKIDHIMQTLRNAPPETVGNATVSSVRDYQLRICRGADPGKAGHLDLPPGNVLAFDFDDGSRVVVRPSGTEPKIKFYFDTLEPVAGGEQFVKAQARAHERLALLERHFLSLT